MTPLPEQKLKQLIINKAIELNTKFDVTDDIDETWEALVDSGEYWDAMSEVREGEVETGLRCEWSRNYESKAVATKLADGSWIGWTYWYGGGKHANPEEIDWVEHAYDVSCVEEEKLVVVRTFSKHNA